MNKKEIIKKLDELGVAYDPKANKGELENVLNAAIKESGQAEPAEEATADASAKVEEKKSGKITKQDIVNFPAIQSGQKDVRVTNAEAKELRDKGVLCGHDPKSGVARIKE